MIGIIYCYTSPVGKVYIGQTIDEKSRRATFLNLNSHYGGVYIDSARKKYGPENFSYKVLENLELPIEELKPKLDELEQLYIREYKSNNKEYGYNLTTGGGTTLGYKFSEESKTRMSINRKGKVFCKRTSVIQDKISSAISKEIEVLDSDGILIGKYKNAIELSKQLSIPVSSIRNCIYRGNLYKNKYNIHYTK